MGRPKDDAFWEYFDETDAGTICKFCGKVFKGSPSISRMKSHLSGLGNRDIRPCENVTHQVKEAALASVQGSNMKRKTVASSSMNQRHDHPISTSPSQQMPNEIGNPMIDEELMPMGVLVTEQQVRDCRTSCEDEVPNYVGNCQAEVPNCMENDSGQPIQVVETKGYALPTTELIGDQFEEYMEKIWHSLLDDDDVSIIGIHGMVGVGKTELAKHINNKLLTTPSPFHCVYWVTVSPDFSIWKLQNAIAEVVQVDLLSVNDENIRAAKLREALIKNKKSVFILDDLWNYIPLKKVGFPVDVEGCKFALTTCSLDVCRMMRCQRNFLVKTLSHDDAWELFMKELGHETELSPEKESIAVSIVEACEGLPLGIETMARKMRGVDDIREWEKALHCLERGILVPEYKELFLKLRRSYDNLNDSALQQCSLYCVLLPHWIKREIFIDYWIDEGIIKGKKSWKEEVDEGNCMLNRLQRLCLLSIEDDNSIHMHRLISHMALQIMEESSRSIVENDKELEEIPDEEYWTEDLVRVSLVGNCIKEIPYNHSPQCPKLLTLLLSGNPLKFIPDCFFKQLDRLHVLDLSYTSIEELPSSISDLVNLGALLLRYCKKLRQVPSLAKLRNLKKLDLNYSGIENVPQGMELLSNLTYLGLLGTELKEVAPGILNMLCRLQVLLVDTSFAFEEIACLRMLETLICKLGDVDKYNFPSIEGSLQLRNYIILVGEYEGPISLQGYGPEDDRLLKFTGCRIKDALVLPEDVEDLTIDECNVGRRFMLEKATQLKSLTIHACGGIELMVSFFPAVSLSESLSNESVDAYVEDIFVNEDSRDREETFPQPPTVPLAPSNNSATFSHLKIVKVFKCPSLKKLFHCSLLSSLQNLEEITVEDCENLEEIIVVSQNINGINPHTTTNVQSFCLPKLRSVSLDNLPELKSICSIKLICNSLQEIEVSDCPKLKLIPFDLLSLNNNHPSLLSSLKSIEFYPKEWWEGLQWMHPETSNVLLQSQYFELLPF